MKQIITVIFFVAHIIWLLLSFV